MTTDEKSTKAKSKKAATMTDDAREVFPFDFLTVDKEFVSVDPSELIIAPFDSRADGDEKLDPTFVQDIKTNGILQPVLATPVKDRASGEKKLMLLAGRRRLRAAIELGLEKIPVHVKAMTLPDALVACGSENMKRRALSFYDEAAYYRTLEVDYKMTRTDIARRLSVSNAKVTQVLALFNLDPRVQKMIRKGDLGQAVVMKIRPLAQVEDPEVQYSIAQRAAEKEWTAEDIAETVERYLAKEEEKAKEKAKKEKEKEKAKKAKKAAKDGGAEEEAEEEESEEETSKFDRKSMALTDLDSLHALLDSVSYKIDKMRASDKEIDEGKLQFERGKLEGLKLASGLKALPKSIAG